MLHTVTVHHVGSGLIFNFVSFWWFTDFASWFLAVCIRTTGSTDTLTASYASLRASRVRVKNAGGSAWSFTIAPNFFISIVVENSRNSPFAMFTAVVMVGTKLLAHAQSESVVLAVTTSMIIVPRAVMALRRRPIAMHSTNIFSTSVFGFAAALADVLPGCHSGQVRWGCVAFLVSRCQKLY
jgi:uncharacterized MAPEG superfamily protein